MATPHFIPSLYVGNLKPEVTETDLYTFFSSVAFVTSTRVCRDSITRASLRYGYVNFTSQQDAQRVLDTLNYAPILGQVCRLMWSQRDPAVRKSGQGNVFIKNLDRTIDEKALYDTFSTFGKILSCMIQRDDTQSSLGFGYVQYENEQDAQKVIDTVNGMLINGMKVVVTKFIPRKKPSEIKFTNVYVKYLDESLTDQQLNETFGQFGEITSGIIMKNETGASRGFGFVNFSSHECALKAIENMDGKLLGSKNIYVARAQSKAERSSLLRSKYEERKRENYRKYKDSNIYVKNLDESVDTTRLQQEFGRFGAIVRAAVMLDEAKRSKGFGFVCFSTKEEAGRAIQAMHDQMLGSKRLYVTIHQRRDERRAHLETIYNYRSHRPDAHFVPLPAAPPVAPHKMHVHHHNMHVHSVPAHQHIGPVHPHAAHLFGVPTFYPRSIYHDPHAYMRPAPAMAVAPAPAPSPYPATAPAPAPAPAPSSAVAPVSVQPAVGGNPVVPNTVVVNAGGPSIRTTHGGPSYASVVMAQAQAHAHAHAQAQAQAHAQAQAYAAAPRNQPRGPVATSIAPSTNAPRGNKQAPSAGHDASESKGKITGTGTGTGAGAGANASATTVTITVTSSSNPAQKTTTTTTIPIAAVPTDAAKQAASSPLNALANLPEADQKRVLQEKLQPLVHKQEPALADRITHGIVTQLDTTDVLALLEDAKALEARVAAAAKELNAAAAAASDAPSTA